MKPEDYKPDLDGIIDEAESLGGGALDRLKRRKIVQWGLAYLAGAWLILQVLDFARENFGWSTFPTQVAAVVLGVGLVAALVLAWYHGEKGRQRIGGVELMILAGLLVVAGFAVTLIPRGEDDTRATAVEARAGPGPERVTRGADPSVTLAIMPFDNLSAGTDETFIAEGLTVEIGGRLSGVADIRLISSSAVASALATSADPVAAGRSVGAQQIVEGTIRVGDDRVRATVTLTNLETLEQTWAETYDHPLEDAFDVQAEVALAIGTAVEAELTADETTRMSTTSTESLAAFQLFERQRRYFGNRPDENRLGKELLYEAIGLDSTYSDAWARLGWRYSWDVRQGRTDSSDSSLLASARAVELDPESAYAQYALAAALGASDRVGVGLAFRRALELDPSNDSVLRDLSFYLSFQGSLVEAADYALRGVKVSPNTAISHWHLSVPLMFLGDYERTRALIEWAMAELPPDGSGVEGSGQSRNERSLIYLDLVDGRAGTVREQALSLLTRYPDLPEPRLTAADLLVGVGAYAEALPILEEYYAIAPTGITGHFLRPTDLALGFALWELGERDRAETILDEAERVAESRVAGGSELPFAFHTLAAIHAIRGERDDALDWFERAYDRGARHYRFLAIDPMFEPIRDDERFVRILDRMEADVARMAAQVDQEGIGAEIDAIVAPR